MSPRPLAKPNNPRFSSGPCAKRPGWSPHALAGALTGRSHRSAAGREKLAQAIEETRDLLGVPRDYRLAIVPASDTGAIEMAMWSLLGPRGVDVAVYDGFSAQWAQDARDQLKLPTRILSAPPGASPDLGQLDFERDVVFAWNGTTTGVRAPDADFIPAARGGLVLCDATSAAFAQRLDFAKLDATTFSWQKALGGEAGHGMLILSPRAVERLRAHVPPWPMPKLFRLMRDGSLNEALFRGETINTPSMLCVEDYLDALRWARGMGGLEALIARCDANAAVIARFVESRDWIAHLAQDPARRSNTSLCLKFADPRIAASRDAQAALAARMVALIEAEGAGFDFGAHRDAPPGLRIWCGATVETSDLEAFTPWLDWAYGEARAQLEL